MVEFMQNPGTDESLKEQAGGILKLFYPKGPKYKGSHTERSKAMRFWREWWSKKQIQSKAQSSMG
jgi:hypothetical protein